MYADFESRVLTMTPIVMLLMNRKSKFCSAKSKRALVRDLRRFEDEFNTRCFAIFKVTDRRSSHQAEGAIEQRTSGAKFCRDFGSSMKICVFRLQ
jgi:hypothetical protein